MKVFAIVAVIAFAAVVSAMPTPEDLEDEQISQMALIPTDSDEIGKIKPEMAIFSDFCISSRDEVRRYLKSSVNGAASKVFNIMFNTLNEVAADTLEIQKDAVNQGAELIKNAKIADSKSTQPESRQEIAKELEHRVDAVQNGGLLATVGASVRLVFNTVIETVSSETAKRLAYLKANFTGENVRDKIKEACDDISYNLRKILNSNLTNAKRELLSSSQAADFKDVLSKAKLEDIGCVTTGRVNMVSRFCDLLAAAGPIIYPMMGL